MFHLIPTFLISFCFATVACADHFHFFYMSGDEIALYGDRQFREHALNVFQDAKGHHAILLYDSVEFEPVRLDFVIDGKIQPIVEPMAFVTSVNRKCFPGQPLPYRRVNGKKEMAINMGCPHTLKSFVNLGSELKRQGLIKDGDQFHFVAIGHGNAWNGFGADDGAESRSKEGKADSLSIQEMREALKGIQAWNKSGRWDSLIFNACLMGSLEVAYHFRDIVEFFFAPSWPVPVVGSDFIDQQEEMSKQGLSDAEIFQQLHMKYPSYMDYHFKYDRVVKLGGDSSTLAVLQALAKSRVIYRGETEEKEIIRVTWEGKPAYRILKDHPDKFIVDDIRFSLSSSNNLIVNLDDLVQWQQRFQDEFSNPLARVFERVPLDHFRHSRLITFIDDDLDMKLVSWRKLAHFLIETEQNERPGAEIIRENFRLGRLDQFIGEFDQIFSTGWGFGRNRVDSFSLFLPSDQFWHESAIEDLLDSNQTEESGREKALKALKQFEFFEDYGWKSVHEAFGIGLGNRLKKETENGEEYEVGRKWMD